MAGVSTGISLLAKDDINNLIYPTADIDFGGVTSFSGAGQIQIAFADTSSAFVFDENVQIAMGRWLNPLGSPSYIYFDARVTLLSGNTLTSAPVGWVSGGQINIFLVRSTVGTSTSSIRLEVRQSNNLSNYSSIDLTLSAIKV